jgi:putative Holliday junction resolvase
MDNLQERGRVLCVDWGTKNLGLAISDPSRTIASPLSIIKHISRVKDAERIGQIAKERGAALIIVGASFLDSGEPTHSGRSAFRLIEIIREKTFIPVQVFDEGGSTIKAREIRRLVGAPKKKRGGHLDSTAAAVILQDYLDQKENV